MDHIVYHKINFKRFKSYEADSLTTIRLSYKSKTKISGLPGGSVVKNLPAYAAEKLRFNPWVRKIPWRRKWQPTPVFLPGKSHGQKEPGGLQSIGSQKSQT